MGDTTTSTERPAMTASTLPASLVSPRTDWNAPALATDLTWNPHACKNGNPRRRGALEGTLLGLPVNGRTVGRSVVFQFELLTGEVRTVWWDGTLFDGTPTLFDVDTDEPVLRNPAAFSWFALLSDVEEAIRRGVLEGPQLVLD